MHTHIFLFFLFLFFYFLFFFGLGPAQPTWAGLDPASPAWSLAQASDPAGPHEASVIQITRAWPLLINSKQTTKMKSWKAGENRAENLPGPFAGNLHVIIEGDASAFEFLLTPSALYLTLYSFPVSLFRLVCFCFFTLFQNTVCTLSRLVLVFVVLSRC